MGLNFNDITAGILRLVYDLLQNKGIRKACIAIVGFVKDLVA
jgi:hypothetical protein